MCGISGIVSRHLKKETTETLSACAKLQHHRGPDFFGSESGPNYLFYHSRLSIIDISDNANQPMSDDACVIVYNGEVYNYRELYQQYISQNYPSSDTSALFELLRQQKCSVVSELDGMFAFALFDKKSDELFLARDRMGIKPLYYSLHDGVFCFASEIRTLVCMMEKLHGYQAVDNINSRCVDDLLALGHSEFQNMPLDGISELAPGCILKYDLNNAAIDISKYFDLVMVPSKKRVAALSTPKEQYLTDTLDQLLNKSVKMHLLSDVPVGALCSGGIDSSLITAIAVRYNPNLAIYHAGVKGRGGEEKYAEMIARHLNVDINYISMDAEQYLSLMPSVIYHSDFPMYHPSDISLYAISDKARQDGVKVLLCGEGADELFGGYGWHRFFKTTMGRYDLSGKILKGVDFLLNSLRLYKHATAFTAREFLHFTPAYLNYFEGNFAFSAKRNAIIRNTQAWNFFDELLTAYQHAGIDDPALSAYISNNLSGHLGSLLHRNDRMCMMASIEARVPFIENAVIEFAMNLPAQMKIKRSQTKYLLKKVAERYIPHKNVYRAKAGFPVPWADYSRNIDIAIFEKGFLYWYLNITLSALKRWFADDLSLLGFALSVEIWGRLHIFQESPEHVRMLLMGSGK